MDSAPSARKPPASVQHPRSDIVVQRPRSRWIFALGPRWVRAATVAHGHQWSPTVAKGSEEPQVAAVQLKKLG